MTTTAKGFTKLTNDDPMEGPDQINDTELFLENLIDERRPDVASLPSTGNWDGRIISVGAVLYMWIAPDSAWRKLSQFRLGRNEATSQVILAQSSATPPANWIDICTVSATSHGGLCTARWSARQYNANSGAARTGAFRVVLDGTQIGQTIPFDSPLIAGTSATVGGAELTYSAESTPTAGAHQWKLQGQASLAPAVAVLPALLEVFEN